MKRLKQGRYKVEIDVDELYICTSEYRLYNTAPFKAAVNFHYEEEWKPTEDDPGSPEYAELLSVVLLEDVLFAWDDEYSQLILKGENLMNFTDEKQSDYIKWLAIKEGKEQRYVDPDNYRPEPDERIRRELGWGLRDSEYDRDAS